MDLGIKDKVALITGGSKGLGRHAALALAREGANVAICARSEESLNQTVEDIRNHGASAVGIVADIMEEGAADKIYQAATDGLGPVDILVNNVGGVLSRTGFEGTSSEDFRGTFDLNVFGAYDLCKLVVPHMKAQQWGRIINIASIWGREHGGFISYMSAKAALIAASKSLSVELAADGITVNSIAPGSILFEGGVWDRFQQSQSPEAVEQFIAQNFPRGKFGEPEPVGDLVAYLASERASLLTGTCINIDGGQSKSLI